jgi:predicted nuclease of predicted toxin-antitoxin system
VTISGLPTHKLILNTELHRFTDQKLNIKEALVNGTRMRIKFMHRNATDCEVLTGTARNKRILITHKKELNFQLYLYLR